MRDGARTWKGLFDNVGGVSRMGVGVGMDDAHLEAGSRAELGWMKNCLKAAAQVRHSLWACVTTF